MKNPTVIYGPMACGKTRNKERLRAALCCDSVVDDWDGSKPLPRGNVLVLTYLDPNEIRRRAGGHYAALEFFSFMRGLENQAGKEQSA
jgi:hypothetical protein